jgi:hypothetical protein
VSLIRSIDCSIAALQGAKLTIIFHIGVITNVNFAKKAIMIFKFIKPDFMNLKFRVESLGFRGAAAFMLALRA